MNKSWLQSNRISGVLVVAGALILSGCSSSSDSAEVVEVVQGNFYVSSFNGELVKPIVDSSLIFGYDISEVDQNILKFSSPKVSSHP